MGGKRRLSELNPCRAFCWELLAGRAELGRAKKVCNLPCEAGNLGKKQFLAPIDPIYSRGSRVSRSKGWVPAGSRLTCGRKTEDCSGECCRDRDVRSVLALPPGLRFIQPSGHLMSSSDPFRKQFSWETFGNFEFVAVLLVI